MKKTAFKTFVYSFVFSLFVIFTTNRAFWRAPEKVSNTTKISSKNITLFLKSNDLAPIRIVSAPTKKIVLSSVADIPSVSIPSKEDNISTDVVEDTSIPQTNSASQPEEKNMNDTVVAASEPLNASAFVSEEANINIPVITSEPVSSKKIVYLPEKAEMHGDVSTTQDQFVAEIPLVKNVSAFSNSEVNTQDKQENSPQKASPSTELLLAEQKTLPKENLTLAKQPESTKPAEVTVAENNEPQMLIPLENVSEKRFAEAKVKTANDIASGQVALNSQNIPISSMKKQAAPTTTASAKESNGKKWQSMKEKHAAELTTKEDPWVVAKGRSFPNNQMILEDKKYKISNEDVEKIFNTNKSEASSQDVQLAAKTVDNLLIPIPEDILNDENLTPQLISSPKNQEIKEELEAKGLIKKEEPKEEPQEDAQNKSPLNDNSSSVSKENGLLDSITSLFSADKNTPQEIGVNENVEEETNSLFSAFTRKQNKLMSKILPTEIRLSFQPNRAEISGQTLKWIKAFAQKTAEEPTTGLEIRIDGTSSPLLQRRRLNLLQNILYNEGAAPEKINTVFTAREPNSFILRTVRINKEVKNSSANYNNRYLQW